ncbi:MAG: iron ABC transporter permease, partial [archaeon]|nr:iron ABC transporter permease [archaeon]
MDEEQRNAEAERMVRAFEENTEQDRIEGKYSASIRAKLTFVFVMLAVTIIAVLCSLAIGSTDIPLIDVLKVIGHTLFPAWIDGPSQDYYTTVVINSRFPRTLLCLITGISLAAAGTIMQGLLRNPLVSPFTLGVSTAASFGAALTIVLGSGYAFFYTTMSFGIISMSVKNILIVILSFVFGMTSIMLVLKIAKKDASQSTLVLSGVVISYLFQAGISLSQYLSDDESLRTISNWLMGGMWNATWGAVIIMAPIVAVCVLYLEKMALDINTLSAGDEIARNVGVDVNSMRRKGLVVSTLTTSVCVAFTGDVGFIGLMGPHMTRMVIGNDSRSVMPPSAPIGASILLFSDIVARTILYPDPLPLGISL